MPKIGNVDLPEQKLKSITTDRPGVPYLEDAPTDYILVNDSHLLNPSKDNTCVILFDWETFISRQIGINESFRFLNAINNVLNRLLETDNINYQNNYEEVLNRLINRSLVEFRTSIDSNLGGSSGNFSLENFEDKWIVKDRSNAYYGQSIIQEGIKFVIDVKGRFNPDYFYRIWTGYVTGVTETSNPTERRLSFTSIDNSRLFSYTRWNQHPAIFEANKVAEAQEVQLFQTNLQGKNGGLIFEQLTTLNKKQDEYNLYIDEEWISPKDAVLEETGEKIIGYDINNDGIVDKAKNESFHFGYKTEDLTNYKFRPNSSKRRLVWGHTGTVYTQIFANFTLYFSEFKTRKDILTDLAITTFYKCFIDAAGHIHYHPPRFEEEHYLRVKDSVTKEEEHKLVHCIFDDDVISQSYTQNEGEICTVAYGLQDGHFGIMKMLNNNVMPNTYMATIIWEDGITRFGYRERKFTTGAIKDTQNNINSFTAAFLLRANQERYQMSTVMPMRPEIQVDRPVYDYNKDKIYYVRNVSHNYSAGGPNSGGTFTTTVICNAGRRASEKISSNVLATGGQYATIEEMKKGNEKTGLQAFTTLNITDLRSLPHDDIGKKVPKAHEDKAKAISKEQASAAGLPIL